MDRSAMIADLRSKLDGSKAEMARIIATAEKFNRGLSSGEKVAFNHAEADALALRERLDELESAQAMDDAAAPMRPQVRAED